MHVHQSLFRGSDNAFFSADDPDHLSDIAKGFIAGQLKHMREICSLLNQYVNSFKRLVPGYEAPVYISWAHRNRTALIRVPLYVQGKESTVRAELRNPDPAANPYLAFAVMLAAGLDGIEKEYELPPSVEPNIYKMNAEEREAHGLGDAAQQPLRGDQGDAARASSCAAPSATTSSSASSPTSSTSGTSTASRSPTGRWQVLREALRGRASRERCRGGRRTGARPCNAPRGELHLTPEEIAWTRSSLISAAGSAARSRPAGGSGAVFGLSGGIDSAVVAALAKLAFPHHTLGVVMPCHSDPQDAEDGALVAHHFGVPFATVDLAPVYDLLLEQLAARCTDLPASRLADRQPQAAPAHDHAVRVRQPARLPRARHRQPQRARRRLLHQVRRRRRRPAAARQPRQERGARARARASACRQRIIDKPPSAGLWADQTDEAEMGLTYEELDAYLLTGAASPAVKARVDAMNAASEHKRALPRIAPKPGA